MLEWRLKAYRHWLTMTEPNWANVHYPAIDYQDIIYYSAPEIEKDGPKSLDEVDPELLQTYEKLGIPLKEREMLAGVAVDAVFDSVSVGDHVQGQAGRTGHHLLLVFRGGARASGAGAEIPGLGGALHRQLFRRAECGGVSATARSATSPRACAARWSCRPISASTPRNTGQFERTLIIADEGAYVSYLEGCTAPMRDENQLHAAVVELVALDNAQIKYSTVQNWYPGRQGRQGRHLQLRHQARRLPRARIRRFPGRRSRPARRSPGNIRAASCKGDNSVGEFYSVALTNNYPAGRHRHQDDPHRQEHAQHHRVQGHLRRARAEHLSRPGEDPESGRRRAQLHAVRFAAAGRQVRRAHLPVHRGEEPDRAGGARSVDLARIGEDQLFYCKQRGISAEDAVSMIVNGFCKEVFKELPMEFAVEAQKLLGVSLEGSVGLR